MDAQSGTVKTAQPEPPAPRAGIGWSDMAKVLLASALAGFTLRGGIGLARLLKRRITEPVEPDIERAQQTEMVTMPGPAPKYSTDMNKESKDGLGTFPAAALAMLAGGGGAYAGWRLADWMMEKRRLSELDADIERAKREYEDLLLGRPQLEVRVPKVAAVMEKFAETYERDGKPIEKSAQFWNMLPYLVYLALTGTVLYEAASAYRKSRAASEMERRMKAFKGRPRRRTLPVRARLAQPRPTQLENLTSATRLPAEARKLEEEEAVFDPTKGR